MKLHYSRLLIAAAALLLASTESRADIIDGLISYWPLDGNLSDIAGSATNNGTFNGTAVENYTAGKFGTGIDLDGEDQYIDVGNDSSLDQTMENGGDGNVSISAWFRVDSFDASWQALIAKGEGEAWRIARRDAANIMSYAGGVGDIPTAADIGPNVNDGEFHHVAAITEQGVSTRLWVDGELVATGGAPTTDRGTNPVYIGANPDTDPLRYWDGLIDDVAIWERVLLEDEIASIWSGGGGQSIDDLLGVPGDADGDGEADLVDFNIISMNMGKDPATREEGDVAGGQSVDLLDFRKWKSNRTDLSVPASGAIPEPSGIALAACGLLASAVAVRRRRQLAQR